MRCFFQIQIQEQAVKVKDKGRLRFRLAMASSHGSTSCPCGAMGVIWWRGCVGSRAEMQRGCDTDIADAVTDSKDKKIKINN